MDNVKQGEPCPYKICVLVSTEGNFNTIACR
jgi:hypothetical protein